MRVVSLIQARMGSTRLPGKVMLPLAGTPVIQHEARRANATPGVDEVVIATSTKPRDDILVDQARRMDVSAYRGPEDDVLGRLSDAARTADADVVIRLSGDNPLVPPELIETALEQVIAGDAEIATNKLDRTFPVGVTVEAMTLDSLDRIETEANDDFYREHVSKYIEDYEGDFDVRNVGVSEVYGREFVDRLPVDDLTELRLTLDRAPDYELLDYICRNLAAPVPDFGDVVELVSRENLSSINAEVEQEVL